MAWIKAIRLGLGILLLGVFVVIFVDVEPIFRDRSMRPPADACLRLDFNQRRCDAVVAQAIEGAGVAPADVASVELGRPDGVKRGLSGSLTALARLHLADGRTIDHEVWCVGVSTEYKAWCVDDPRLQLFMGANHDVPCNGDQDGLFPEGCATPIVLDPEAVAEARPLRVDALDIPIAVGHHEIELGYATLPNGFLERAGFTLADLAPDGVAIPEGIRMVVVSTDPSRPPFENVYDRGTFPGVEEVVASLVFDVDAASPGAVLQVRDVIVE
jgi:hypothetical protein